MACFRGCAARLGRGSGTVSVVYRTLYSCCSAGLTAGGVAAAAAAGASRSRARWASNVSRFNASADYYATLGVTATTNAEEIKAAFRELGVPSCICVLLACHCHCVHVSVCVRV